MPLCVFPSVKLSVTSCEEIKTAAVHEVSRPFLREPYKPYIVIAAELLQNVSLCLGDHYNIFSQLGHVF